MENSCFVNIIYWGRAGTREEYPVAVVFLFFFFFSPSSLKDQTNIFACGIMLNSETHVFPWVVA